MRRFTLWLIAWLSFASGGAHAMDGEFDREAEVKYYLEVFATGDRSAVTAAARSLSFSGIADVRIASVVNDRLLRDYPNLSGTGSARSWLPHATMVWYASDSDAVYGAQLAQALGSFGIAEYAATLEKIARRPGAGGSSIELVRDSSARALKKIAWHDRKNKLMASQANQADGENPNVSRVINLLLADDRTYRDYALHRIVASKQIDPRLLAVLEHQVIEFIERTVTTDKSAKDNLIAVNIKLLAQTDDSKYCATMEKMLASNAAPGVKKQAQVALSRLQWNMPMPQSSVPLEEGAQ